ncbi:MULTISPECIES: NAD(P)H-dependent glycerol-3-phosphate dehydrogenase [Protofrankia]|uniref:Glycerol-3-phosphate dehydrogenase [NAD(P)+] n=1 Tax=Candidatus Protofrankia datiscae TaxID=2716812 RepID=F8B339_9ACTN|nr:MULTISPECIES: NAD(P)H-dependent glycerol-3-phosphate dehydrogenase [Protofrankia]AEH09949.1 Glycerol-3-phosphate dehydrogenase (NAD(P)+) [Candidatus Protofrankia datiscae]
MGYVRRRAPRIAVVGAGSWGTTVAAILSRSATTTIWARSSDVVNDIEKNRRNSRYTGDAVLPDELRATSSLEEAVSDADTIVMGVPSHGFSAILEQAAPYARPWVPVVSLVKGLEQETDRRMTEIVADVLPGHPAGVLAGPNIAKEILDGYAAAATLAMPDVSTAAQLADLFRTPRFRIYSTTDVIGVELCGPLKNVFAIAAGMGDGAGAGHNTKAMVITRAVREMTLLGEALGGEPVTFYGLAGTGDLIVTCTSPLSRNRCVGEALGRGQTISQAMAGMKQVAEGVRSASVVMRLAARAGVELPIAREVDAVVNHGSTARDAYRGLLKQAPGHEVRGTSW